MGDDDSFPEEFDAALDPRTPDESEFRLGHRPQKLSNERPAMKAQVVRSMQDQYAQSTTLDREMTIHMTLTRPDLRTPEEPRSVKVNSVPLEQCALLNSDDKTAFWDSLPDDESKMKRFWKKLKMR